MIAQLDKMTPRDLLFTRTDEKPNSGEEAEKAVYAVTPKSADETDARVVVSVNLQHQ